MANQKIIDYATNNLGKEITFDHIIDYSNVPNIKSVTIVGYNGNCLIVAFDDYIGWEKSNLKEGTYLLESNSYKSYWHINIEEIITIK